MTRFALFCCHLALGILLRLCFVGLSLLGIRLRVKPVAVVFDVLFSFIAVFGTAVLAFIFNDGILEAQNVAALIIGFGITTLLFTQPKLQDPQRAKNRKRFRSRRDSSQSSE